MKENSIEEDIETIKYNMKIIKNVMNNFEDELCEKMQMKTDEVNKAIEHILSDYKRVLKENEELSENKLLQDIEIKKNFIPIQKVKDKIEELKEEKEEYFSQCKIEELDDKIQVLQKLLEK